MKRRFVLACLLPVLAACGQGGAVSGDVGDVGGPAGGAAAGAVDAGTGSGPQGRFGCTQSIYDSGSGMYQFQPRGFVEFAGGAYAYRGFENPSEGRVDAGGDGGVVLRGGYLDGGEFVPVDDRPGQFTLTTPGFRWSCKAG